MRASRRDQRLGIMLFTTMVAAVSALHVAITGSSQGIGASAAKLLLTQGHVVYHACRSTERAEEAVRVAGGGLPMVCDLADLESVRSFAAELARAAPKLDVLCLNAAVAPSTKSEVPLEGAGSRSSRPRATPRCRAARTSPAPRAARPARVRPALSTAPSRPRHATRTKRAGCGCARPLWWAFDVRGRLAGVSD